MSRVFSGLKRQLIVLLISSVSQTYASLYNKNRSLGVALYESLAGAGASISATYMLTKKR